MADKSKLTDNEANYLVEHPEIIIEQIRTIKGEEFKLNDRPYLVSIYHEFKPFKPKVVIWKSSRKMEKTETGVNLILLPSLFYDYFKCLYTIARGPQVHNFSVTRFEPAVNECNGGVYERLKKPTSVSHKRFISGINNNTGEERYNETFFYSAWLDASSILGHDPDYIHVDEAQDMVGEWYPKIKEMQKLSQYKHMLISGTARDEGDYFDDLWKKSTMNEWFVTCRNCNHEHILTIDNILGPPGRKYKGCIKCKAVIDVRNGVWKPTCPDLNRARFVGYHTWQIMHPSITANDIWDSREDYGKRQFDNEVLGISHAGGLKPITMGMLIGDTEFGGEHKGCINKNIEYVTTHDKPGNVMGIDCGKGHHYTVMSKEKRILYQGVVDTMKYRSFEQAMSFLISTFNRYNCEKCVIDFGYGANETKEMQNEFGEKVRGCRYGITDVDNWYKYVEKDDEGHYIYRLNVNRSRAIELVIDSFTDGEIEIPYGYNSQELVDKTFKHYVSLKSNLEDLIESKKTKAKERPIEYGHDGPDHFLHTVVYCLLALREPETPEPCVRRVGRRH